VTSLPAPDPRNRAPRKAFLNSSIDAGFLAPAQPAPILIEVLQVPAEYQRSGAFFWSEPPAFAAAASAPNGNLGNWPFAATFL
jgi:hypothetical protein